MGRCDARRGFVCMSLIKLNSILGKESNLSKLMAHQDQDAILCQHWDDIFGALSKDVQYSFLRDGVIHLEVQNPMWVNEIAFYKPHILEKANSFLGKKKAVKDLKIHTTKRGTIKKATQIPVIEQPTLTLEETIRLDNLNKQKQGLVLCLDCQKVYVKSGLCIFCLKTAH